MVRMLVVLVLPALIGGASAEMVPAGAPAIELFGHGTQSPGSGDEAFGTLSQAVPRDGLEAPGAAVQPVWLPWEVEVRRGWSFESMEPGSAVECVEPGCLDSLSSTDGDRGSHNSAAIAVNVNLVTSGEQAESVPLPLAGTGWLFGSALIAFMLLANRRGV